MPPRRSRRLPAGRQIHDASLLGSGSRGLLSGAASVHAVGCFAGTIRDSFPSRCSLKDASGIRRRRDVTVMLLDHLHGCAHLLGEPKYVNTFYEPEGRVGVAEAIRAAPASRRADQKA